MADQFSPIEQAGGWWQLRRSYDGPDSSPGGLALVVKRRDGKTNEWRGTELGKLIDLATAWCEPVRVRRVKKPKRRA